MADSPAQYELGSVSRITPEALGVPGKRTFRILLESGAASACMWLEKEQLNQLGLYLQEAIDSLSNAEGALEAVAPEPPWSGGVVSLDFKIGKMALAHSEAHNSLLLVVHDLEHQEDGEPTVSFWLGLGQAQELAREALQVCAAGRPICVLCGRPIDPDGHVCPRANGHAVLDL